ncbi:MAG: GxxExxY protein [Anaerolineales bacterium]|nr:GxxExxY protein [Anaerolineales bacterium]MDW8327883.1 GxxExxY protein [Anaerolineales bacterium]
MTENDITKTVVDLAYRIHKKLESVYPALPSYELTKNNLRVATELPIFVTYKDNVVRIANGLAA